MGLRLSVRRLTWQQSVQAEAAIRPGLIPVVKGNGYGFGRMRLMPLAARLSTHIAVGNVYEAADVPDDRVAVVLTPHIGELPETLPDSATLTVASIAHVDALRARGWTGSVVLKLRSSMHRFGVTAADLASLSHAVDSAGFVAVAYGLHFPLVGTSHEHSREVRAWLAHLDPQLPVSVSHLDVEAYQQLREGYPAHRFEIRCGTSIWHGAKTSLHLSADVIDIHAVSQNDTVGYRGETIPANGHVVIVAAGSSNGVTALDDGRSPFHFARQRLALIEPPYMHTSMLFVALNQTCPSVGERVDVQRPLTRTDVDEVEWLDD